MRQLDLTPLYRSTIGFDRLFNLVDQAAGFEAAPSYPPYNIERTGEDSYRIYRRRRRLHRKRAFGREPREQRDSSAARRRLGSRAIQAKQEVLYQGIAARAFERRFQLADHVYVKSASLENGLLHVDLVRELPEAQKPRQVPIGKAATGPKAVETESPPKAA